MGTRGPVPKGEKSKANRTFPGVPPVPPHLTDAAKAEYTRAGNLLSMTIEHHDQAVLAAYAQATAEVAQFNEELKTEGYIITNAETGGRYLNPKHSARSSAHKLMLATAIQLGLTPAARARLQGTVGAPPPRETAPTGPAAFDAANGGAQGA